VCPVIFLIHICFDLFVIVAGAVVGYFHSLSVRLFAFGCAAFVGHVPCGAVNPCVQGVALQPGVPGPWPSIIVA
jgi:hypothetical protein